MGIYRSLIDANRSAVRAFGAAHPCPFPGGPGFGSSRRTEEEQLPFALEPPVD